MRLRSVVFVVLALLPSFGCGSGTAGSYGSDGRAPEGTSFPEWEIPVPEDAVVHSFLPASREDRTETLELERDLVLQGAFDVAFYRPRSVDVDSEGNIYVLDSGHQRVVVFDSEGAPLRTFGGRGQGPGEFQAPRLLSVAGNHVVVHDQRSARWSLFTRQGEPVADHDVGFSFFPIGVEPAGEDLLTIEAELTGVPRVRHDPPAADWTIARRSLDSGLESVLLVLEVVPETYWFTERAGGSVPLRVGNPVGAVADDGTVYATPGDQYQVLAIDARGDVRWALRAAFEGPAPSEEVKQQVVDLWKADRPELTYGDFVWPDRLATIENLELDGDGNLYVFPYAARTPLQTRETTEPVPVDVYSPEGDRLFAGWSPIEDWDAVHGPYLYRVETDPESEEEIVARYRLRVAPR